MVWKRERSDLRTPMELWAVGASRYLKQGRLIPLREMNRLWKEDPGGRRNLSIQRARELLKTIDPFFRVEQRPLLRRSWNRWWLWNSQSKKHFVRKNRS